MTNIKKNPNASELFTKTEIENTPFVIIHNPDKKIAFGTFGKYKITKDLETIEDVKNELTDMTWDKIITIMTLVVEMLKTQSTKNN